MEGAVIIDWIDAKARLWGMAKRRLLNANGYPESFAGKIMDEGYGSMSGGNFGSRCAEGFTGDALEIAVAIHVALQKRRMTANQYAIFFLHYVVPESARAKQRKLKIASDKYYDLLNDAQSNLEPFVRPLVQNA